MPESSIELFEAMDPADSLVVVGFHTTGAAGPIATQYVISNLDIPLVGHITAPILRGVVHVKDGRATSPIRIHGGEVACEIGKPCKQLIIITAEVPLPPDSLHDLTETIVQWAKPAGLILALDAVARAAGDESPDVYAVGADQEALDALEPTQAKKLEAGLIIGLGAHLMNAARAHNVCTGALVVEAKKDHPDGRAAAALVRALDPLIPQIVVDPGPLEEEAADLEQQIERALAEMEETQTPRREPHTFI